MCTRKGLIDARLYLLENIKGESSVVETLVNDLKDNNRVFDALFASCAYRCANTILKGDKLRKRKE